MTQYLLISIDLSGAEWYVTGYLANEPAMIEVHIRKGDAHCKTASLMTGLPEDLIKREDKLLDKLTDPDEILAARKERLPEILCSGASWLPMMMTCRQAGKKGNHGLNYGMEYMRFALENMIPETESKQMVRLYRERAYPGLPNTYYPSIQQELMGGEECADCGYFRYAMTHFGRLWRPMTREQPIRPEHCTICGAASWKERAPRTLRNCFGRQVVLLSGWGPNLYNEGYSFKPQSTVADSVIQGMCSFYEDPCKAYTKAHIWTTTHDELTFQFPIEPDLTDMAAATVALAKDYLRPILTYPPYSYQLDTDVKVGFRYGAPSGPGKFDGLIPLGGFTDIETCKEQLGAALDKLQGAYQC